ncbi:phage portal protein [Bifidobacterium dentium]|uniref:phage portal protein n=1 Tax=Bifidobacterium dentium TaxID=1689 RepID=UPI003D171373
MAFYLTDDTIIGSAPKFTGSEYLDVASGNITSIKGVDDEDMPVIRELLRVWREKYPRNLIRGAYYDCKERFKDFGISIPDQIKNKVEAMIGWPELAVRSLSDLSDLEGFSVSGDDTMGVSDLFEDNQLDVAASELIVSAYKHSCSFLTIAVDPDDSGRIIMIPRSADWSAGIWDRYRHRLSAALTITEDDENGRICGFEVWLPGKVYECSGRPMPWRAEKHETHFDQPTAVSLAYDRQMNRPFGHSRISRSLMSLVDAGFRTVVRMEASAEFYSAPKLWFIGANKDAFSSNTWTSLIQAINAISYDADDRVPELKQVSQASMQPHSDMLKTMAMLVASQTRVPVDYLGITLDNPTSAEAMASAERRLTRIADKQNTAFGRELKRAMGIAVALREGSNTIPDSMRDIHPVWAPTREVSDSARADAFTKIADKVTGYADSDVGLERLGLSREEITRLRADQSRQRAKTQIDQLKARLASTGTSKEAGDGSQQSGYSGDEPSAASTSA